MRCLVVAVRWLCTNFIYTHFFFPAADFSCCPSLFNFQNYLKKKNLTEAKGSVWIFQPSLSTDSSQRLTFGIKYLTKHLTKISFDQHRQLLQLQEVSERSRRLLISPAQVSHTLKVHLSEIFPKDGSCCFYVAFLQAALTSILLFVHAVVSIIRFVAVTRWRMYKGRWGGGALWLTPETCFWPGRKWRPLACRRGSWDVAVVFFFFCKCHMIIRWPRLGEDLDPADRLRDDRRKRPSGLSKPASFWESESRTSLPVWARNIVRTQTLQVLQHGATRVWLQLS